MESARGQGFMPLGAVVVGVLSFRLSAWGIFGNLYSCVAMDAFVYSRLAQTAVIVACMVVFARRSVGALGVQRAVGVATAVMMLATASVLGISDPQSPLFMLGRVAHGAGSAVLLLGWGSYTCSLPPRSSGLSVAAAFAVYGVLTVALAHAPIALLNIVAVGSPALCGLLLLAVKNGVQVEKPPKFWRPFEKGWLFRPPWGVVGLLVACSVACAMTELTIAPVQETSRTFVANWLRMPVFLGVFVVTVAWVFGCKRDDPDRLWGFFGFLIPCGLLGYSSFCFINLDMAVAFMRATQDCLMIFAWVFVSGLAYRQNLPPVTAFGWGSLLFLQTTIPAGVLRLLAPQAVLGSSLPLTAGLAFVVAIVLIAYVFALVARRPLSESADGLTTIAAPSSSQLPMDLSTLVGEYGLSAREVEVVGLLCRGYTMPQTAERLNISLNTVRSHAKSIYAKLNIHGKEGLIDLVDELMRRAH